MVHVPPEPATPNPHLVVTTLGDRLPRSAANQQRWEVDPCIDGQLQRAPESAVHLHDDLATRGRLPLALDHGYALPRESIEEAESGTDQGLIEGNAFPVDADAAPGRLLPQAPVGERGDRPPPPAQREKPLADTRDPVLQQDRERRRGQGG